MKGNRLKALAFKQKDVRSVIKSYKPYLNSLFEKPSILKRIAHIFKATKAWLHPDHPGKKEAVDKTVERGLFSREDVEHQLAVLRENVDAGQILEWAERVGLQDQKSATGKKVLCLHAGNLPLVGFQTALGVILSGAHYYGKLSRKDPYLLTSFLEEIKQIGQDQEIRYSTNLKEFESLQAGAVVFAGSSASVPEVKNEINRLQAASQDARYLIRTAKFSMAYLEEWSDDIALELAEAMLRYGGQGCRSVAVVVAPFGLEEVKEPLATAMQNFWKQNPPHLQPGSGLKVQYAYNEAIQREQLWMEHFLIQESEKLPETDYTAHWVKGSKAKLEELDIQFGDLVQTVYTTGAEGEATQTEPLALAQRPPLWWKPDGKDVIEQLIKAAT